MCGTRGVPVSAPSMATCNTLPVRQHSACREISSWDLFLSGVLQLFDSFRSDYYFSINCMAVTAQLMFKESDTSCYGSNKIARNKTGAKGQL